MIKKVLILFVIFATPFSIFAQDIDVPAHIGATAIASFQPGTAEDIQVFIRGEVTFSVLSPAVATAKFPDGTSVQFLIPAGATWSLVQPLPHTLKDADGNPINLQTGLDDSFGGGSPLPGPIGGLGDGFDFPPGVPVFFGELHCRTTEIPGGPDGTTVTVVSCSRW